MPGRSTWPDLGGLVKAVAVVGGVAAMIPGPVGVAGYLEKRLRFQEELLPLVEARLGAVAGSSGPRARAVIATAFACFDVATTTWVDNGGEGDIIDLYDECLAAVRG